ncbi:MAG: ABC transporter permease, partial [Planktomarina temperata]|nr:ABC transporter permease [Planktomarina temperata]
MTRPEIHEEETPQAQHPVTESWAMFRKNTAAVAALALLILITFGAIFGPALYPTDPFEMVWAPFSPPGEEGFLLGTDYLG